ncbi:MAG: class I SAM-dependent methyltransferase [Nitrospirae bacterium]|nr:class I SAM-dependent methyltransferase [Nitrospirota bacterium]
MKISEKKISDLMLELSKVDYGEPLPELSEQFLEVWKRHYFRIMDLVPERIEKAEVLEIGIGFGVLAVLCRRFLNLPVTATEHPSRGYIHAEGFRAMMDREAVPIIEHDLQYALPFNNDMFDLVFYCDVLEHLPTPLVTTSLQEIKRVLKEEGYLIISTPNLARLPNRLKFLHGSGINPPVDPRKIGETYDHVREFTLDEIQGMLDPDFHILRYEYGLIPFFNQRFNKLNSLLFSFISGFGDEMYILSRVRKNIA